MVGNGEEHGRERRRVRGKERIIREALRGSLGWGITAAAFGALIGWERGGLALGLRAGSTGALAFAMMGWVLGTAVGIADYWPLSRLLGRVLGGTFVGAMYGVVLLRDAARVSEDHKHLVALLWALAGALLGASTSVKFIRRRPVGQSEASVVDPGRSPGGGKSEAVDVRIR